VKALWLEKGAVRMADMPAPSAGPGEALVRVRLAGLCRTDLELARGYYSFAGIPGHEFVGEVVEAPDAREWIGRRVVAEINVACGECAACRAGHRTHCERRTVIGIRGRHGALAEIVTVPAANLHAVPDALPDAVAVFAEPVAAALEVQEQVRIGPDLRVVVIGDGKLGQLVARTLALTGCELRVVGRHQDKLARLRGRGIDAGDASGVPARWADLAVECTGHPDGLARATALARARGTIVLKSTYEGLASVNLSAIVVDEMTLVGSRCGPMDKAVALLAHDDLGVGDLVTATYPLAQAGEAFAAAARPGVLKVLVRP
jgi:threonine dehydrogenase-like Zn-dependent dehydrogenase